MLTGLGNRLEDLKTMNKPKYSMNVDSIMQQVTEDLGVEAALKIRQVLKSLYTPKYSLGGLFAIADGTEW